MISWEEINNRFELIENQQAQIKELLDTIEIQLKEWKEKYPGN